MREEGAANEQTKLIDQIDMRTNQNKIGKKQVILVPLKGRTDHKNKKAAKLKAKINDRIRKQNVLLNKSKQTVDHISAPSCSSGGFKTEMGIKTEVKEEWF